MKFKDINAGSALMFGVGIAALCYGIYKTKQAKKAVKNVTGSIDRLANMTSVEVSDEIIRAAAEKAAYKAASDAVDIVRNDINTKVSASVYKVYDHVEETTEKKFIEQAEKRINIEDFSAKVEKKAATIVAEKFAKDIREYASPFMAAIMKSVEK